MCQHAPIVHVPVFTADLQANFCTSSRRDLSFVNVNVNVISMTIQPEGCSSMAIYTYMYTCRIQYRKNKYRKNNIAVAILHLKFG